MNLRSNRVSSSPGQEASDINPDAAIETTEQLRTAIDRGSSGEKVDAVDPAAAPLGTDDEAGGTPNSMAQIRLAAAHEVRARPDKERQRTSGIGHAWWLIGFSGLIGLAIIAAGFLVPR